MGLGWHDGLMFHSFVRDISANVSLLAGGKGQNDTGSKIEYLIGEMYNRYSSLYKRSSISVVVVKSKRTSNVDSGFIYVRNCKSVRCVRSRAYLHSLSRR